VPPAWLAHIELNARWYAEPAAVRAEIDIVRPR
jgi:hypothetical protein